MERNLVHPVRYLLIRFVYIFMCSSLRPIRSSILLVFYIFYVSSRIPIIFIIVIIVQTWTELVYVMLSRVVLL